MLSKKKQLFWKVVLTVDISDGGNWKFRANLRRKLTLKAYCRVAILGCDHLCFLLMARLFKIIQIWFFFHPGLYPSLPWPTIRFPIPQPSVEGKPKPGRCGDQKRTGNLFRKQTNPLRIHTLAISTFTQYLLVRLRSFLWHNIYIEQGYHTNYYIYGFLCCDAGICYIRTSVHQQKPQIFVFFIWMNVLLSFMVQLG